MVRNGSNGNQYQQQNNNTALKKRPLTEDEKVQYQKNIVTDSTFAKLLAVPVWDKIEEKNGLSYLSWADSWAELKKRCPSATYKVYEEPNSGYNYFTDGKTCWVKVSVTVDELEYIEYMPIKDYRNNSILLENVTSMDVLSSIQRGLSKACARHGLGLTLYGADELGVIEPPPAPKTATKAAASKAVQPAPAPAQQTAPAPAPKTKPAASASAAKKEPPLERAKKLVLTFGTHQGKSLGEVYSEEPDYIRELSDSTAFTPENDQEVKAQMAAKYLLEHLAA